MKCKNSIKDIIVTCEKIHKQASLIQEKVGKLLLPYCHDILAINDFYKRGSETASRDTFELFQKTVLEVKSDIEKQTNNYKKNNNNDNNNNNSNK